METSTKNLDFDQCLDDLNNRLQACKNIFIKVRQKLLESDDPEVLDAREKLKKIKKEAADILLQELKKSSDREEIFRKFLSSKFIKNFNSQEEVYSQTLKAVILLQLSSETEASENPVADSAADVAKEIAGQLPDSE